MYSIVVLEARDSKSSCQLGHSPSKTLGRTIPCLFQLLVEATNPWHPLPRAPLRLRLLSAQRSISHTLVAYVGTTLSSSRSLLLQLYPQVHSPICASIPALQMGASVPFF